MAMTFLVGGARSGKSGLAVRMAVDGGAPVVFIATGERSDEEMAARIARHRAERPSHWRTVETPRDVAGALAEVDPAHFVVLDCLTLWTANMLEEGAGRGVVRAGGGERSYKQRSRLRHRSRLPGFPTLPGPAGAGQRHFPTGRRPLLSVRSGRGGSHPRRPPVNGRRLAALLAAAPPPDQASRLAAAERARNVLRPAGALAALDEVASFLAGWQRTASPAVKKPAIILAAADHGVAARGVSAYPPEVTAAMLGAIRSGVATCSVLAPGGGGGDGGDRRRSGPSVRRLHPLPRPNRRRISRLFSARPGGGSGFGLRPAGHRRNGNRQLHQRGGDSGRRHRRRPGRMGGTGFRRRGDGLGKQAAGGGRGRAAGGRGGTDGGVAATGGRGDGGPGRGGRRSPPPFPAGVAGRVHRHRGGHPPGGRRAGGVGSLPGGAPLPPNRAIAACWNGWGKPRCWIWR